MKIVHINETYKVGSTGKLSYDIMEYARRKGNDSLSVSLLNAENNEISIKTSNYIDKNIHALLSRITGLQGYYSHISTWFLIRKLKKFKPDIVHLHNIHSNYINLKILFHYFKKEKINVVLTLHDCWFFTGKCTYFVVANCKKWENSCGSCPLLKKDNVNPTWFFDRTKKCIKDKKKLYSEINNFNVVGVSNWIAKTAENSILKDKNIYTIYNWVDLNIFTYRKSNLRKKFNIENKKVLLFVSNNISPEKGYNELMELSKVIGEDFQIIVIGKNKKNLYLPKNIIHICYLSNQIELAEYYSMADICINTTKYETFGLVTVESMACGTPVIGYRNTGTEELIIENTGELIDEEDGVKGIIIAINKILNKDQNLIFNACENHVKKNFSKEINCQKYLDLYSEIIKRK